MVISGPAVFGIARSIGGFSCIQDGVTDNAASASAPSQAARGRQMVVARAFIVSSKDQVLNMTGLVVGSLTRIFQECYAARTDDRWSRVAENLFRRPGQLRTPCETVLT